jgi:hypothetical protein
MFKFARRFIPDLAYIDQLYNENKLRDNQIHQDALLIERLRFKNKRYFSLYNQSLVRVITLEKKNKDLTELNASANDHIKEIQPIACKSADHEKEWQKADKEIDRLNDEIDKLIRERTNLRSEIERLRDLLMDQADKTTIESIDIDSGGVTVNSRPPHWALLSMAQSFLESLGDAPNWQAIQIGPIPSQEGMLIATVQRADGDSPVETVGKMRDCIKELFDCYKSGYYYNEALCAKAMSLINPTKKD